MTEQKQNVGFKTKVVKGVVLIRRATGAGRWGRPVISSKGDFYMTAKKASEQTNSRRSAIVDSIANGTLVNGVRYSWATEEQTKHYIDTARRVSLLSPPVVVSSRPVRPAPVAPQPHIFVGVQWPDKSVTVRLASGGSWLMHRLRAELLPIEILNSCQWMKT